ncbi:hypothetical protein phiST2_0354 [Vibrio phage phi-ST2]|uniref:Uncharacterized protein n=2 Tax=Schizotequatrovirus TaxID=1198137 RepID=V9M0F6_9CAUD|nr:hypothetical protein CF80_gp326 [Vibrio phage VH7D]YP_009201256.1 hypothetical protein AVU32_gp153 [Vibrio phage ValKK3]ALP47612.1 hypothetical protein phiST2_0354 [Vibrio phage phi-ST2]QBX05981.1 hypothetical protein Va3_027 [Vibrio phage Va3]QNJ54606.1 hypothetical protein vBValMR10Z_65 [Vibrio phage vB_ValM_R10Z]QNJ54991.1 hypothetical protein vBValMR11Z_65 [Vibrio phage vB_ValM_R11Z]URQ03692.1 hypothetical protein PVA23_315 [Vibrio phage PVA23]
MSFETKIVCYGALVTEVEHGWGTRPDGYIIAKSEAEVLKKGAEMREIAAKAKYGYEYIGDVFTFEPTQKAIEELTNREFIWTGRDFSEWGKRI